MSIKYSCEDFLGFQEALKKMRDIDDKIIYALNTSLPTESFKGQFNGESTCRDLYDKLNTSHKQRETALKQCILFSADHVKALKEKRDNNREDIDLDKKYKSAQRKLRVLQYELNVEDIIKDRSYKAFNEKCRMYFQAGAGL
ncbi:protein MIX23 [Condylostylus longicornis]|uniref:protein MIX23 n=1 Tax=Condylostylus longicornis TaxID=2530218 RepID=UPI00244E2517|nr:protein MIX23 [Condylostylus longicornis]